jgi:hypothetical protein
VDPLEVADMYLAGTLRLPPEKIKFDNITITPDMEVGKDYTSPIYEIFDKNGESIRVVTTDHEKWINNNTDKTGKKYICHWCRIEHVGEYIILPIKIDRDISTGKLIFHGTGSYCCFECAYADLKTKWYCGPYIKDLLYSDTETLLRFMYHAYTGKSNLVASPDWILHEKNGGYLSDKDFFNEKTTYVKCANLILNTAKITYYQNTK